VTPWGPPDDQLGGLAARRLDADLQRPPVLPDEPASDEIDPVDIAHALSLLCRYGGHVDRFYSVAEHCVLMSNAVAPEHALAALLHDATEAYVCDVPRPLKAYLDAYRAIEDQVWAAIAIRFGLALELPAEVKQADTRILLNERAALMSRAERWPIDDTHEPLDVTISGWEPAVAELAYGVRLVELTRLGGMRILAIDPGPERSASSSSSPVGRGRGRSAIWANERAPRAAPPGSLRADDVDVAVIEQIESFGMAVGREVFETSDGPGDSRRPSSGALRSRRPGPAPGREARPLRLAKAKDSNIRQALIDRFGGSRTAIGRRRRPGRCTGSRRT
jgi:hypothetical protein